MREIRWAWDAAVKIARLSFLRTSINSEVMIKHGARAQKPGVSVILIPCDCVLFSLLSRPVCKRLSVIPLSFCGAQKPL